MKIQKQDATQDEPVRSSSPSRENVGPDDNVVDVCAGACQIMFENAVSLNQEMMRFAGERLQADMEALQALSQCTNWPAVASFQSNYSRTISEAYQAEFAKLAELASQAMTAGWKPLIQSVKTDYEKSADE